MIFNKYHMGLINLSLRVKGAVAVPLLALVFKALSGIVMIMDRSVVYHQTHDLFALSLLLLKKEHQLTALKLSLS